MKKQLLTALCLVAGIGAFAQTTTVKEAESAMKSAKTYADFAKGLEMLQPALTNPETANRAATYAGASAAGFKFFDKLYGDKQFGKNVDLVDMSNALMDAYAYGLQALQRDTVVNAKGKTEMKFSKNIVNQICGHFNDFNNAGAIYWENKDFPRCYDAFTAYINIAGNPRFGKQAPPALPDSTKADVELYRAYAAMSSGTMLPQALEAFDEMIALGGVNDPAGYDFAYNAAYQNDKDYDRMLKYTSQAVEKFGSTQPRFMEMLVNLHIDHKDYPLAKSLLESAIASEPNNPGYYFSQGFLEQAMNDLPAAKASFKKAVELKPDHARALLAYANIVATEFDKLDTDAAEKMSKAEYDKYFADTLKPMLQEIIINAEAAYAADENMYDALRLLKTAYYRMDDGANLKRVEDLLL